MTFALGSMSLMSIHRKLRKKLSSSNYPKLEKILTSIQNIPKEHG